MAVAGVREHNGVPPVVEGGFIERLGRCHGDRLLGFVAVSMAVLDLDRDRPCGAEVNLYEFTGGDVPDRARIVKFVSVRPKTSRQILAAAFSGVDPVLAIFQETSQGWSSE